jgi:hypothetical protein
MLERLLVQPSSGPALEKGTQDWEWTEMKGPDEDVDPDDMPVTAPKRI